MSFVEVRHWYSRAAAEAFWVRLASKSLVAALLLVAMRALWSQDAAPVPAVTNIPEGTDSRGYKVWLPVESLLKAPTRVNQIRNDCKKVLKGELPLAEKQAEFTAFYTRYQFPMWTQTTDRELKSMADDRVAFLRDLEASRNEAHTLLVGLALPAFTTIVRDDKFHPAVRYNAMMIVGSLNDQEPSRTPSSPAPAVPMARALRVLLDEFKRPENTDAIRMAALLGLARHLEWENEKPQGLPQIPADVRRDITKELLALAQSTEVPAGHSAEGHVWFRRRAVEALGYACQRRPDPEVAEALDVLVKDEATPVALRCTAAATLGKITLPPDGKLNPTATAKELGYLALVACDAELTRVTSLKKDEEEHAMRLQGQVPDPSATQQQGMPMGPRAGLQTGGMMPGGGGMMPGGGDGLMAGDMYNTGITDPKAYRFDHSRRRLRQQLYCVQLGLTGGEDRQGKKGSPTPTAGGPGAAAKGDQRGMWVAAKVGPDKDTVDDIYGKVRKLIEVVEVKAVDVAALEKELRKEMKNLEASVGRPFVPPADPTKAAPDEPTTPTTPTDKSKNPKAGPKTKPGTKTKPGVKPGVKPMPKPPIKAPAAGS